MIKSLRDYTPASVDLGRAGHSLPTRELLNFQLAHARARDAVRSALDVNSLVVELNQKNISSITLASAVPDRTTYLHRPDLGRQLNPDSRERLAKLKSAYDAVFVIADGLSALAVHRHATPLLDVILPKLDWNLAPLTIVQQGRVAIGDEIGEILGAHLSVVLIGERPGLSSPNSLGISLKSNPHPGRTQAQVNDSSN